MKREQQGLPGVRVVGLERWHDIGGGGRRGQEGVEGLLSLMMPAHATQTA